MKRAVGPVAGGADRLDFDLLQSRIGVDLPTGTTPEQVIDAVQRTGMRAERWEPSVPVPVRESFRTRWGRSALTLASGVSTGLALVVQVSRAGSLRDAFATSDPGLIELLRQAVSNPTVFAIAIQNAPQVPLYLVAVILGVWPFLPKAWHAVRAIRPDMNLLMTVAALGAVAIGEWLEAATVAFLFAVSLALEAWSLGRARNAISALLNLAPPTARVRHHDGREELMSPGSVAPGALFVVQPHERLPLDGVVQVGQSDVDQSPITGESSPVSVEPESTVFAGTINGEGTLVIRSTRPAGETTLAQIVRMVGQSQTRRTRQEQWVERFARVYTPLVMSIALACLLGPPLLMGAPWMVWVYNSLVLLVIACPCALVISTPVSVVAGLAAAARQGVLIKGGLFLEIPARLNAIAFDKTGTLTRGAPVVKDVVPVAGRSNREVVEWAAAMELRSHHPVARAIVDYANQHRIETRALDAVKVIPGRGVAATFDGENYWLGSRRYLVERGLETADLRTVFERLADVGRTVVIVGNAREVYGFIALSDELRPETHWSLAELRRLGIRRLVMLTGDNEATARVIASAAEIGEYRAELLPADKVELVEEMVREHGTVAMIGDGVNDARAMAAATVGIAMGAIGSDAAIETADIALMSDDLSRIPWLIHHARRTVRTIRWNVLFSLATKGIFVVLTLTSIASLWAAIAADMGASLLVTLNGLRLLRAK